MDMQLELSILCNMIFWNRKCVFLIRFLKWRVVGGSVRNSVLSSIFVRNIFATSCKQLSKSFSEAEEHWQIISHGEIFIIHDSIHNSLVLCGAGCCYLLTAAICCYLLLSGAICCLCFSSLCCHYTAPPSGPVDLYCLCFYSLYCRRTAR